MAIRLMMHLGRSIVTANSASPASSSENLFTDRLPKGAGQVFPVGRESQFCHGLFRFAVVYGPADDTFLADHKLHEDRRIDARRLPVLRQSEHAQRHPFRLVVGLWSAGGEFFGLLGIRLGRVDRLGAVVDGITFTFSPGTLFDRTTFVDSGAFTYADLYDDFVYGNSVGAEIDLTMTGLTANASYNIRFYSSDLFTSDSWPYIMTNTFTPTTGTGSPVAVTWDRTTSPTSNLEDSVLGTFMTSVSGTLVFHITGDIVSGTGGSLTRLNGL